ncbi:MAG: DNA recombination protein RmuC, partial [Methyloprofundus sp.]|nr:DNA recombination protein RmuC [Methyloprofundus sp.]
MTDPYLIASLISAVVLLIVLIVLLFVLRKVNVLADSNAEQVKIELVRLLQQNEVVLKEGLIDSRRELREVSAINRREVNDLFKDFQDTLLRRVVENSSEQNRQLEVFKSSLNNLSENLLKNSNEFKQS